MPMSPDEVRTAWRMLVDEPLPDDALLAQMCTLPSLQDLRRMVMETFAFQLQLPRTVAKVPLSAPPLSIEVAADPKIEASLLALVREKWLRMGEERPHWSVTGNDEHMPDRLDENQTGFEASGQDDLNMILAVLARNGLPADLFAHACDFGCGVG